MSPRAFLSYSWTSPAHEQWVLELAIELRQNGVDVVLDKWDLREGQDKFAFMEQMVTDPEVSKVIVVSDRQYAEKADARAGGVGTESQIISKEVYERVDQKKFAAVLPELRENGRPYLPAFLAGRIYIDLSGEPKRRENFEQLVRWLYDKPLHVKPPIGASPEFLRDSAITLGTSSRARRAVDAVKLERSTAPGALYDYFETFIQNLDRFENAVDETVPDALDVALQNTLLARDELVEVLFSISRYRADAETYETVARFFEMLMPLVRSEERLDSISLDMFRLLAYELVLYWIASQVKHERFEHLRHFFAREYLLEGTRQRTPRLRSFVALQQAPRSLIVNQQRGLLRMIAQCIKARASRADLTVMDLAQADLVALVFVTANQPARSQWQPWVAGLFVECGMPPLFQRAESQRYFVRLAELFGVTDRDDLISRLHQDRHSLWFSFGDQLDIDLDVVANLNRLASRP